MDLPVRSREQREFGAPGRAPGSTCAASRWDRPSGEVVGSHALLAGRYELMG